MCTIFSLEFIIRKHIDNNSKLLCYFPPTFCILRDLPTKKVIGSGKQYGGLYYMSPLKTPLIHQVSQPSNLWHLRLGHPSPSRLKLATSMLPCNNILL